LGLRRAMGLHLATEGDGDNEREEKKLIKKKLKIKKQYFNVIRKVKGKLLCSVFV
jgi:hypothetical protein